MARHNATGPVLSQHTVVVLSVEGLLLMGCDLAVAGGVGGADQDKALAYLHAQLGERV